MRSAGKCISRQVTKLSPVKSHSNDKGTFFMFCNESEKKEKHRYLRQVFERERTSGVRLALYKVCCLYASLFPYVPEWKIPNKVFSILNSSGDTLH